MISEKITKLINEQIVHEQYAAQYYLCMSAWFYRENLEGIANYFRVQSKEELLHADKMFDYLNNVGAVSYTHLDVYKRKARNDVI